MPTKRQIAFVKALPETRSVAAAARMAGYSPKRAKQAGRESLLSVTVQDMIKEARIELLSQGATVEALCQRVVDGLSAIQTKRFIHKGQMVSSFDSVDYHTRLLYLRLAFEIFGILGRKVSEKEISNREYEGQEFKDKNTNEIIAEIEHQLECHRKEKREMVEHSILSNDA